MRRTVLVCVALCSALGCSSEAEPNATAPTYYQVVKPILDAKCGKCHVEGGIAPMPLTTYKEAARYASSIATYVSSRVMPPWGAAPDVREYRFDASLTQTQIDAIGAWVRAGAPPGDPREEGAALHVDSSELPRVDLTLSIPSPYTPTITPNEYRCFVLDWPYDHPVYVSGFDARPGNPAIVHHLQAYLAVPSDAPTVVGYDTADPGPGYTCFGGPSPDGAPPLVTRTLGGWTPGRGGMVLPEGTGILIEPGSKVVLQVHYHAESAADMQPDQSALLMTIEEQVDQIGYYVPWTDSQWAIDPTTMLIPAGSEKTAYAYEAKPTDSLVFSVFSGNASFPNGFYVHTVYPHTHLLAKTIEGAIVRATGDTELLVSIPRWDFDWQREYVLAEPAFVGPNDELRVSCTWSNTFADQPIVDGVQQAPHDVVWGEGTEDEMCSLIVYVTEKL
jgi:hypothetical protein